jgi:hypothetical protein
LLSIETSCVALAATEVYHFPVPAEGQEIAPPSGPRRGKMAIEQGRGILTRP